MSVPLGAPTTPGYLGNPRLLSAASGGTPLSTTTAFIAIPPGIQSVSIVPRDFTTAIVAVIGLNPFLTVLRTNDLMATNPVDYSEAAQDGAAGTLVTLSDLPTLANGGAVFIGAADLFTGIQATIVAGDSGAGTIGIFYWNGTAWANTSPTDNTSNMGSSGSVTWTSPGAAWVKASLNDIIGWPRTGTGKPLYWIRMTTSAAYDSSVTLSSLYAINQFATPMELVANQEFKTGINRAQNGGCIQAATNDGTAMLIVNGFY